jgi:hypothetical protein
MHARTHARPRTACTACSRRRASPASASRLAASNAACFSFSASSCGGHGHGQSPGTGSRARVTNKSTNGPCRSSSPADDLQSPPPPPPPACIAAAGGLTKKRSPRQLTDQFVGLLVDGGLQYSRALLLRGGARHEVVDEVAAARLVRGAVAEATYDDTCMMTHTRPRAHTHRHNTQHTRHLEISARSRLCLPFTWQRPFTRQWVVCHHRRCTRTHARTHARTHTQPCTHRRRRA